MSRRSRYEPTLAEQFGELRADFAAAKSSRFRRTRSGVPTSGSGADYHYRSDSDYLKVMEYARDMDRNDAVVGQLLDRAVVNIVQDGFTCDPATGDEGVDREHRDRWNAWCEDPDQCDLAGERTFSEMEHLVLRQSLVDGDHLVLPNVDGGLELVEAHRCRTPSNTKKNVVHGVELGSGRRRLRYWLTKDEIDPWKALTRVGDTTQIDARDADGYRQVFHVLTGKRASQTRGVSALAPIFDVCGMFEDLQFAQLVRAQIAACMAVFREQPAAGLSPSGGIPQAGSRSTETQADGTSRTLETITPGMQVRGLPGEKLQMQSPNVPNPEYFPFVKSVLTLIGINVGMPLVLLLLDASETNFSGFRGALDQARMGFRTIQRRYSRRFHSNVYVWKVRQWRADDPALRAAEARGVDIFAHRFNTPSWPYIEPLKDRSAELLAVRNALTSQRRRCAERGVDWQDLAREIVEDNARLIELAWQTAEKLNEEYTGLDVNWREVAMLPTPDGLNVSFQAAMTDDGQPAKSGERKAESGKQTP